MIVTERGILLGKDEAVNKSVASTDNSIEEETNGIAVSILSHKYIDRLLKAGLDVQYEATSKKAVECILNSNAKDVLCKPLIETESFGRTEACKLYDYVWCDKYKPDIGEAIVMFLTDTIVRGRHKAVDKVIVDCKCITSNRAKTGAVKEVKCITDDNVRGSIELEMTHMYSHLTLSELNRIIIDLRKAGYVLTEYNEDDDYNTLEVDVRGIIIEKVDGGGVTKKEIKIVEDIIKSGALRKERTTHASIKNSREYYASTLSDDDAFWFRDWGEPVA